MCDSHKELNCRCFLRIAGPRYGRYNLDNKLKWSSVWVQKRRKSCIFVMCTAIRSFKWKQQPLCVCSVDFAEAFDSVNHNLLWKKLSCLRVSRKLVGVGPGNWMCRFRTWIETTVNGSIQTASSRGFTGFNWKAENLNLSRPSGLCYLSCIFVSSSISIHHWMCIYL